MNPDAAEVCDGLDNNCDDVVDNDATDAEVWYEDDDEDGFGDPATATVACEAPAGLIADGSDCLDQDATVHPGAAEICDDLDNDCDGAPDDNVADLPSWYADTDGDGHGDPDVATASCDAPADHVASSDDCDDARDDIHPGAPEDDCTDPTDYNCDGSTLYADADGDGHPACADCDDLNPAANPAAAEVCDAADVDEDCDGFADDADADATGARSWFRDRDGDWLHAGEGELVSCEAPAGYTTTGGDCDDYDTLRNPGAAEVCDAADVDEDCDGLADDADPSADAATWSRFHRDSDGDGHGDPSRYVDQCDAPAGYVATADDCDDTTAARSPDEAEVCDAVGVDEDCDGLADDADPGVTGGATWLLDADGDGYGGTTSVTSCEVGAGYVTVGGDCDDTTTARSPSRAEVCDAADVDEDCDGLADDADPSATGETAWYEDADGDTFGWAAASTPACDRPSGHVADASDCDDGESTAFPGGVEVCGDGIDQDCSGADDECPPVTYSGVYDVDVGYSTKLVGLSTYDELGFTLAAGDFNGDGVGDLYVTGNNAEWSSSYPDYGVIYGYHGALAAGVHLATDDSDHQIYNTSSADALVFGLYLANVGDLDGDGRDDLWDGGSTGYGQVTFGGDTGATPKTAYDYRIRGFGAAGGRLDGPSGTGDLAVGYPTASTNTGEASLYSGTSTTAYATLTGETTGDYAGEVLASADVDGDGVEDLWVGARGQDAGGADAGAAYLVYMPVSGTLRLADADAKVVGDAAGDAFGGEVTAGGDLDGDGREDVVVGASLADDGAATATGACYMVTGVAGGTSTALAASAAVVVGEASTDYLGSSMALGDANGDGVADLLTGTSSNDAGGSYAGAVWLFYGPLSGRMVTDTGASAAWLGHSAGDRLGAAVAFLPDTDGDGDDELVMGATWGEEGSPLEVGAVYIWDGE